MSFSLPLPSSLCHLFNVSMLLRKRGLDFSSHKKHTIEKSSREKMHTRFIQTCFFISRKKNDHYWSKKRRETHFHFNSTPIDHRHHPQKQKIDPKDMIREAEINLEWNRCGQSNDGEVLRIFKMDGVYMYEASSLERNYLGSMGKRKNRWVKHCGVPHALNENSIKYILRLWRSWILDQEEIQMLLM